MISRTFVTLMSALCFAGCGGGGSGSPPPTPVPPPPAPAPPAPTITTLAPAAATAAGSNFVLTVTGTGFVATSVINWNGSARTTTFVNATNLQTPIPATDIATAGTITITVVNAAADGGTSAGTSFVVSNPAPSVTSVSPALVTPGGPQFVLTVNGAGFVATSTVKWNGADRATTFVSATQLNATITAADIAAQGSAQVTVFNSTPGGGTSSQVPVAIGNPIPQVSQLAPGVARPGGPAFDLTLVGTGFVTGVVVNWDGAPLPTTFVSATEVQVAVPPANIATEGFAQLTAVNPAPGGGASSSVVFTIAPFGVTERVSVATDGSEANDHSDSPSISATGRFVAFTSAATNLVPGDVNGVQDIFLRDTCVGIASGCTPSTERVSLASDGSAADGASDRASISADGRYVAFTSTATNLVAGDTNGVQDIFVRDTCATVPSGCTPATSRVSVATDGSQGSLFSSAASISGDGRFVAFISQSILVLGDINAVSDAFIRDTCTGAAGCTPSTTRVSEVSEGFAQNLGITGISTSSNGRYVAFASLYRETLSGRTGRIFVFDTCFGAPVGCSPTALLAAEDHGELTVFGFGDRSLSIDGRFAVYRLGGHLSFSAKTVLIDTCIGAPAGCTISRWEFASHQDEGNFTHPTLSPDGRFAAFSSFRIPFSNPLDAFAFDTCISAPTGCVSSAVPVSQSDAGVAATQSSYAPSINSSGSLVAFTSDSNNLVPGDVNVKRDIFLARTGLTFQ